MPPRLSKSRFTTGLQCAKYLWWAVHEADAPELVPDPALQARFDSGHAVGEAAQRHVPGGVLIHREHGDLRSAVAATVRAMQEGASVLYEAAFFEEGVFVAVDILEHGSRGWNLIEVKSSTGVKDPHIPDAAVQAWVLRQAGVPVQRVELMHLNRACTYPDLSDLFLRADITQAVQDYLSDVPSQVRRLLRVLRGDRPEVPIGDHCRKPHACPFVERCWPAFEPTHVSNLYLRGARLAELEAAGIESLAEIPDDPHAHPVHARQKAAALRGGVVVDPGLADALAGFAPPFAYLDFETVGAAIPVWDGCHPYDQVPVQFVCYGPGPTGPRHAYDWVAESGADPRPALTEQLLEATEPARTVFAYYASFERQCIDHLAAAVPHRRGRLRALRDKIEDLHPLIRDHVYHPGFAGSFSIKAVLPALLPELDYADLEVTGGSEASAELERILIHQPDLPGEQRLARLEALRAYCRRDAWGMVALHDWLLAHATRT